MGGRTRAAVYISISSTPCHNPSTVPNILQEAVAGVVKYHTKEVSFKTSSPFLLPLKQKAKKKTKEKSLLQSAL
jgi:hypothetical protein